MKADWRVMSKVQAIKLGYRLINVKYTSPHAKEISRKLFDTMTMVDINKKICLSTKEFPPSEKSFRRFQYACKCNMLLGLKQALFFCGFCAGYKCSLDSWTSAFLHPLTNVTNHHKS